MKKWRGLGIVLFAMTLGACSQKAEAPAEQPAAATEKQEGTSKETEQEAVGEYTIALIAPFTGDNAQYGNAFKTGVTALCNEVNESGGINGAKLNFEVFDDAADAAQSTNMAQIVTGDEKYIAAIGSYSSTCTLAFGSIFDEAQMPVMVPCAGNSTIATEYNYTFQRGMTIPIESALMARYAVQQLDGQRIAFIALNNDAGLQFMENATKAIEDLKAAGTACETVATETFNEGEVRDYSAMVLKIKDANPDVIVVNMGYVECAAILNQARQAGLTDVKWLGNQSMYTEDFTNLVGDAGVGFHVSTGFYAANPDAGVQEFIEQCKAIDGNVPNAYQRNSYECAAMIAQCLKDGAGTRQELYDALVGMEHWDGKTGGNKWINRQSEEEYLILQYQGDGEWKMLELNK